jgi:polynucleotide 5'-hydroxyl-kinase GRC3/NOL9
MMRHVLPSQRTLIVRGPASFTLITGDAKILGEEIPAGQRRVVAKQKQLPIEAVSETQFELTLGKSGEIFEIHGSTIPSSWGSAAATLSEMREGKVIILGRTDVGKSTLCVYLLNRLRREGRNPRIIDADIGQADLGPPTTIAKATPTQPIVSLTELDPTATLFIGHTTPSYVERKLIKGIQRLAANEEGSLTIINTDGWVTEPNAIRYKINLITVTNPDLVLGMAYANELKPIMSSVRAHTMQVDAAKNVLARTRYDRRTARTSGYRRSLEGGVVSTVPLSKVRFIRPSHFPAVTARNSMALRNIIIGLLDEAGYLTQIGILIDVRPDAVRVYSRQRDAISNVELGFVKLSTSGREIGFL